MLSLSSFRPNKEYKKFAAQLQEYEKYAVEEEDSGDDEEEEDNDIQELEPSGVSPLKRADAVIQPVRVRR